MLRQYLWTGVICAISILGLYVILDSFTNLDEFLRYAEKHGGLLRLLGSYYACQAVMVFDRAAALIALITAMFTVTWIQRHQEMTALLAAGVSRARVVVPVVAASCAVVFLAAANRELLIPRLRDQLSRRPQDLPGDQPQMVTPRYDYQTDILLRGHAAFRERKRISEPNFLFPPKLSDYGRQLVAEEAFYEPAAAGRPSGYRLVKVKKPEGLTELPSLKLGDRPVVITPRDAPDWLAPDECFVVSEVDFDQLYGGSAFRYFSSTRQLIVALRNPSLEFGADLRVAIHSRIVQPFLDITLVFLGLPLVLRRDNRNIFLAIGLCITLVAAFLAVGIAFQQLGNIYYISPAFAAWGPLMVFVPIAVWLSESFWE